MDTPKPAALSKQELAVIIKCPNVRYCGVIQLVGPVITTKRLIATIAEQDKTHAAREKELVEMFEKVSDQRVALIRERDALKAELATAKAQGAQEHAEVERLTNVMLGLREYWNGSRTDGAMYDALHHIETEINFALTPKESTP